LTVYVQIYTYILLRIVRILRVLRTLYNIDNYDNNVNECKRDAAVRTIYTYNLA